MQTTNTIIVGAGPIGLELAVALKSAGADYLHIEAAQIGQTMMWYPRQARFFSSPERIAIAGIPLQTADQSKATREEYLAYLRSVVKHFDLRVNTYERVVAIDRQGCGGFVVRTHRGGDTREYRAEHVVMAVGDMHHPRMLHIPGEELRHVSHYFDEPHAFFQQDLLIVGGRNSAVEAAIRCFRAGARVTLSCRKSAFDENHIMYWLLPEIKHLIKVGSIRFHPGTQPLRITPTHVTLADVDDAQQTQDIPADFVLMLTGYEMDTSLFKMAGCSLVGDNGSPDHDEATMETDVPGLYVAGTAAAGTQVEFRLFIENCHVHVDRIFRAITGRAPDRKYANTSAAAMPES